MTRIDLDRRVAVITGGARVIGLATARMMLSFGARVAIWDTNKSAMEGALLNLQGGDTTTGTQVDVSDEASVAAALRGALSAHGKVDILVNSAGILGDSLATVDLAYETWRHILDVNLTGTFLCSKLTAPGMISEGWGRIVNIASLAGKEGTPGIPAYSASKAGVIALTKAMGKELATTGVLVNCIAPAAVNTEMAANADRDQLHLMIEKSPMRRLGTAEECAALVCWLASEEMSFSTGACFDVSGGRAVY